MAVLRAKIRPGVYYDSLVLMQLQRSLSELPDVQEAGVVMGTAANKALLERGRLLAAEWAAAKGDDLIVVVRAQTEEAARSALDRVDDLLVRRSTTTEQDYVPQSLDTALSLLPEANWVLISVPGPYAADVARDALMRGKHIFLFSNNVALEDEIALKQWAAERGLMVMGPDCGTAIVNGVGLGFANRVRRGPIGIVAASGTGLQQLSCRIHQLGGGVSHAFGTGGRDPTDPVGAVTARQAIDLLARDPATQVIVLVSKPPATQVADSLLRRARAIDKPVVVDFVGYRTAARTVDGVHFAGTFDEAATLAVQIASSSPKAGTATGLSLDGFSSEQRYLRGLYSGGTLAYEALLILRDYLPGVYSNAPLDKGDPRLADAALSVENAVVDLGADEFTVGRPHPMLDNELRVRRLAQEAADPTVGVILLDVVLGFGAHPDPAGDLAPAIASARVMANSGGRRLEVVCVLVGTDEDSQGLADQTARLSAAGARVETSHDAAVRYVGRLVCALEGLTSRRVEVTYRPVDVAALQKPLAAVNVGLETFAHGIVEQGASVIHVDWRPPAGGDKRLMAILRKMKHLT